MAKLEIKMLLAAQALSASADSASFDVQDNGALALVVNAGDFAFDGSNYIDLVIEHSDDDSSFSPVGEGDLYVAEDAANGLFKALDEAGDAEAVHVAHYLGNKRYVRVASNVTGTVSAPISISAIGGYNEFMPPLS